MNAASSSKLPARTKRSAAVGLAVFLFASGALTGALAHRYYDASVVNAKSGPESVRLQYMAEMKERIRLTPDQTRQLQGILDETRAKAKTVRDRYHPEMVRIKEEQISRVKAILNTDQIPAYEKLVAEREARYRQAEERDRQAGTRR